VRQVIECIAWSNSRASAVLAKHLASDAPEGRQKVVNGLSDAHAGAAGVGDGAGAASQEGGGGGGASLNEEGEAGAFLASGSRDKTIRVWHVATGRRVSVSVSVSVSALVSVSVSVSVSVPVPVSVRARETLYIRKPELIY
jgi:hypothetical protein